MHQIIEKNFNKITEICRKNNVKTMWVFGSINSEKFSDKSDIDILVKFNSMDFGEYADTYFDLCDELENLFSRKVDVITENSLSNPFFIKSVQSSKELIYERTVA